MVSLKQISILFLAGIISVNGISQQKALEGFFTSEANAISLNSDVLVSIKKYNPTETEIKNASNVVPGAPMNILKVPFETTDITMANQGFESNLYCISENGVLKWSTKLGVSNKSTPSPLAIHDGYIYTGEAINAENISIKKLDRSGKMIWETKMDSLHNVNDFYVEDDKVSVLVSFDASQRVNSNDGSYYIRNYPIYFFVQLDINTGDQLSSQYQLMGNYLSKMGYEDVKINTNSSYLLHSNDSVIFLKTDNQESATVLSEDLSKESEIIRLAAGTESYHILTRIPVNGLTTYSLVSNFYGKGKKYQSTLPFKYSTTDRTLIYRQVDDNILTIINNHKQIIICKTSLEGESTIYKELPASSITTVAGGQSTMKIFLIQVTGREKPGSPGRIAVNFY